jgi:regulator of sigma E protease
VHEVLRDDLRGPATLKGVASYVYAVLGFAALIVLHEAGHFVAAKAVGMRVERFSLFFGPMWAKHTVGETEYGIGVIPLGGYVKITGMNPNEEYDSPEIEARGYYNQPVWKRIVVIAAGPAVNLVVAFLLIWGFYLANSHYVTTRNGTDVTTNRVWAIEPHSAATGVLKVGDVLVSVDGVRGNTAALQNQIRTHTCAGGSKRNGCEAVTPAKVVVRRHGVLRTLLVRPRYNTAAGKPLIGFEFSPVLAGDSVWYSVRTGSSELWDETKATVSHLAQLFRAKDRRQLSGVVGAYEVTQQEFSLGVSWGIYVLSLISLSLALINLFPFLPLDGGHIFWALVEKFRGHKVAFATMEKASIVGFALVLILFAIGLSNDLSGVATTAANAR